jgi:DNA modification methylase
MTFKSMRTRPIEVFCAYDEMRRTEEVTPNPRNPNRHPNSQIALLAKMIAAQGWRAPITVSSRSGLVVRGHARLAAARIVGAEVVPVDVQPYESEAAEWADLVADNKVAELSEMDVRSLTDLLATIDASEIDLELTGFTVDEIAAMMAGTDHVEVIEDEAPDLPAEPVTRPGNLWLLGKHRVLCGDSTSAEDMARLMDGRKATMVFTDPPYGVDYVGKTKNALKIRNDAPGFEGTQKLVADSMAEVGKWLSPGGAFYVCSPAGDMELAFRLGLIDAGLTLRQQIVWAKDQFVMGRQDYQWRHEAILYGWKDGAAHFFAGGRSQDTVWEIPRPKQSTEHPTIKPVALVAKAVSNSSSAGAIIADPFLGSGTALVACEQLGRICYGMEIDERYADVIVQRWENLTGKTAVLHG